MPRPMTPAAKDRIVCVCVSVCSQKLGKQQTFTTQTSYWQTFAKPFGYKVMTIYITNSPDLR